MVPASRPQQTREETEAILRSFGYDPSKHVLMLFVRGYYADSMGRKGRNDQAMYDDAAFVISPTAYRSFNANTDPQKAGARHAMLKPGGLRYYMGLHKRRYAAWRPYPEGVRLPCTRDGVESMCSATNIHEGGWGNTQSEGCMTIYKPQYPEFQKFSYAEAKKYGQKVVEVRLIENAR